jgi:hypothetical protein
VKYIFAVALIVAAIIAVVRIAEPELTNAIFEDEIKDIAAELGARTGRLPPKSDVEMRDAVMREAATHEIDLDPKQVRVNIAGTPENRTVLIAVTYSVPVDLFVYKFDLHLHPQQVVRQGYLPRGQTVR